MMEKASPGCGSPHRIQRLKSKQNEVSLMDGDAGFFVLKRFLSQGRLKRELMVQAVLAKEGLAVPALLRQPQDDTLFYEYIEGLTLLSLLETMELEAQGGRNVWHLAAYELCTWLVNYYQATKKHFGRFWLLKDAHLRNFIWCSDKKVLYGVDFEECGPLESQALDLSTTGFPYGDVGRLCAFILTYDPPFTAVKIEAETVLKKAAGDVLHLEETLLELEIRKQLDEIRKRRTASFCLEFDDQTANSDVI